MRIVFFVVPQNDFILRSCLIHLKKLDLLAVLIMQSNLFRRRFRIAGNEDDSHVHYHIVEDNFPKLIWILFCNYMTDYG